MTSFSAPSILRSARIVGLVNHLLEREAWARSQLLPYAGRTAWLAGGPLSARVTVTEQGLLAEAAQDAEADVSITLPPQAMLAFIGGGVSELRRQVRIGGDAEFAATLGKLAEQLRWEPEEDLARLIGDAPAYRAARLVRDAARQTQRAGRNLLETFVEYLADEDQQLVRRAALDALRDDLVDLRESVARLEKRVERAERAGAGAGSKAGSPPLRGV